MIVYKIYLRGGKPWQPTTNNTTGVWWPEKSAVLLCSGNVRPGSRYRNFVFGGKSYFAHTLYWQCCEIHSVMYSRSVGTDVLHVGVFNLCGNPQCERTKMV